MDVQERSVEARVRRSLQRRGYRLEKCTRRDPRAVGYGRYRILRGDLVVAGADTHGGYGLTLREAETWPQTSCERDYWGALSGTIAGRSVEQILKSMADVLPAKYCDFDGKKRGDALNLDLYGFDVDQQVAVVQVRHAFRRRASHFLSLHKTYVLCGRNENGAPFRHPVSAHAVRAATRLHPDDPSAVVRAAQRWMWQVTDRQLAQSIRQGDVLLVPERAEPDGTITELGTTATLAGSHAITADRIVRWRWGGEWIWALNPRLDHLRGQHAPIAAQHDGWYSIRVAREADAWDFSARLGD